MPFIKLEKVNHYCKLMFYEGECIFNQVHIGLMLAYLIFLKLLLSVGSVHVWVLIIPSI